jgi:hypothetical protein
MRGLVHRPVAGVQAVLQVAQQLARCAVFGQQARGKALDHAAHANGVGHLLRGEAAHLVAAAGRLFDQAFVLEAGQRQAHRGARGFELLGDRNLGQPLSGHEFALEDHVAQLHEHAGLLRVHREAPRSRE